MSPGLRKHPALGAEYSISLEGIEDDNNAMGAPRVLHELGIRPLYMTVPVIQLLVLFRIGQ